ncbi:pectinesterase inhibitor 9-like [Lotus japonicus]|uniref:pectinesterase inhibitor 9-like n=1 Tax=Lotus japonicus TaxID=34305 RepID=UPI0025892A1C|nr:pectinesterase inhibitor 9-like [Lotus japonicus]
MAQHNLSSLAIFFFLLFSSLAKVESSLARSNSKSKTDIESSCEGTLYPEICIRYLSKFGTNPNSTTGGPQRLAHIALSVSLARAVHTRGYLLEMAKELKEIENKKVYLTVQDCVNQINDSVDQLSQAIRELRRLDKFGSAINDKMLWHISNVETWVSTALTDASSCVQSFPGHRMSKKIASIKVKAKNVAEVTSNALALFHRYATAYRQAAAARTTKKP